MTLKGNYEDIFNYLDTVPFAKLGNVGMLFETFALPTNKISLFNEKNVTDLLPEWKKIVTFLFITYILCLNSMEIAISDLFYMICL